MQLKFQPNLSNESLFLSSVFLVCSWLAARLANCLKELDRIYSTLLDALLVVPFFFDTNSIKLHLQLYCYLKIHHLFSPWRVQLLSSAQITHLSFEVCPLRHHTWGNREKELEII